MDILGLEVEVDEGKSQAVARAVGLLGGPGAAAEQVLGQLYELAFEQGRLAALDELQDRFCVCMK